jgi:activator of 2-hydroxyglutaryl-CoA dehydratase
LQELVSILDQEKVHAMAQVNRHQPLFKTPQQLQDWSEQQKRHRIAKIPLDECGDVPYFLGIDSGSTTTKLVLVDAQGRVAFS